MLLSRLVEDGWRGRFERAEGQKRKATFDVSITLRKGDRNGSE
jgi:hypothetical protein